MTGRKESLDLMATVLLIVLCASWGLNQIAIKVANHSVPPVLQAGIRSAVAAILVAGWMAVRGEPLLSRDGTLWLGIVAGLLFSAEFMMIYWGLEYTNASRAVVFLYISPFVVALGAKFFIPGESFQKIQVLGLICAFSGIVCAFGGSFSAHSAQWAQMLIGDLMLVSAAIFWGVTTVLIKSTRLAGIPPSKTLLYQLAVSALLMPICSLAKGEPGILGMTPVIAGCIAYQAVWIAFITYLIWFWLIREYPASRLASFTFLTPLFGVLAGVTLLNEPVTKSLAIALVMVSAGIYLVNRHEEFVRLFKPKGNKG